MVCGKIRYFKSFYAWPVWVRKRYGIPCQDRLFPSQRPADLMIHFLQSTPIREHPDADSIILPESANAVSPGLQHAFKKKNITMLPGLSNTR